MILLSVIMTWVTFGPFGLRLDLWLVGLLGWLGILEGILSGSFSFAVPPGAGPLEVVLVLILAAVSVTLVVVGGIVALIPTKTATKIGRRSKSVSVGAGILSLIGVGLFVGFVMFWVSIFQPPSVSYGLGFFVAILGSILVIASAAIPKGKKMG